jgi:hypothetical protein
MRVASESQLVSIYKWPFAASSVSNRVQSTRFETNNKGGIRQAVAIKPDD